MKDTLVKFKLYGIAFTSEPMEAKTAGDMILQLRDRLIMDVRCEESPRQQQRIPLTKTQWIEKYGGQEKLDTEGFDVVPCEHCADPICHGWRVVPKHRQTLYLSVNIGPGPNGTAMLIIEGGDVTSEEQQELRHLIEAEDDENLRTVAAWLMATRPGLSIRLSGAHHDVEQFDDDEGGHGGEACLFCGEGFRWRIRCPQNREGLI